MYLVGNEEDLVKDGRSISKVISNMNKEVVTDSPRIANKFNGKFEPSILVMAMCSKDNELFVITDSQNRYDGDGWECLLKGAISEA